MSCPCGFDDFCDFVKTKTNATVLRNPRTEADDLIARWIDKHPDQNHVIISTDKDLNQLITPRVKQYNGVNETTLTHEGWFDAKGKPVIDKKLKAPKPAPDTEWIVFEKAMRGDPSDNIFSAYPGVRTKGTKNKIGLQEAFADLGGQVGDFPVSETASQHVVSLPMSPFLAESDQDQVIEAVLKALPV